MRRCRSAPLLAPFGLRAPLQAVRGYHIEIPGGAVYFDAPVAYLDERVIVTPMSGRVRTSSYMEFAMPMRRRTRASPPACADRYARSATLANSKAQAGWARVRCCRTTAGIGRALGPAKLFYAIGHQHIGLTLAPITAELIADIVAQREPRIPIAAYDLQRF